MFSFQYSDMHFSWLGFVEILESVNLCLSPYLEISRHYFIKYFPAPSSSPLLSFQDSTFTYIQCFNFVL